MPLVTYRFDQVFTLLDELRGELQDSQATSCHAEGFCHGQVESRLAV